VSVPVAVGVDALNLLRDRRGIGRYVRALLQVWHRAYPERIAPTLLVPHAFPGLLARRFAAALGVPHVRLARRSRAGQLGLDLVWYPWNGMTWTPPVRSVVTIHDVWPFVSPASDGRRREREQRHYLHGVKHAVRFIAPSQFTKAEAIRYLHLPTERIDVVPQGVMALTGGGVQPAQVSGAQRYVLFVGEPERRKDLETLARAMQKLPERSRATTALVIAGRGADGVERPEGTRVEIEGEVSDERLASLYTGAAALAFPSRYEGFGFPVLEAMLYGTPVVASDAASVPEAGGDAALYFHAGDSDELAHVLDRVLTDEALARRMAAAGRARASVMSQELCARRTLEVFERVAGR